MPAKGKGYQELTPRLEHLGGAVNVRIWWYSSQQRKKSNLSREEKIGCFSCFSCFGCFKEWVFF